MVEDNFKNRKVFNLKNENNIYIWGAFEILLPGIFHQFGSNKHIKFLKKNNKIKYTWDSYFKCVRL